MPQSFFITKASGAEEPFSEEKLRSSLNRAQVSGSTADLLTRHIKARFQPGMSSTRLAQEAFKFLKKQEPVSAARYNLKKAIMDLGPSGHPFETFVGELLKAQGYATQVAVMVSGFCVIHEVDVVAERNNTRLMVECKFHNQTGIKCDVKIALYVQARFEDIQKKWLATPPKILVGWQAQQGNAPQFNQGWLVTNTKLTSEAVQYSRCAGLHAVGWNYPTEGSLQHMIERTGLHPLTCLIHLSFAQKQNLLAQGIVLCQDLLHRQELIASLHISPLQEKKLKQEIQELCG